MQILPKIDLAVANLKRDVKFKPNCKINRSNAK